MKNLNFILLIMVAVFMASCLKNDEQATGNGDAIIVAKKSGPNTVYGISLYAYTFSSFQSVKAVNIADTSKIYTLKAIQGYNANFSYDTPDAEFTTTKPAASTFTFSAVFENGVSTKFQDALSDQVLPVPIFEKCQYNSTLGQIDVIWTLLPDADSYSIKILDGTTLVFASPELISTRNTYSISASGGGWANGFTPQNGKTYTVKLFAYLYEAEINHYSLQAASLAETTVAWNNAN